MGKLLAVTALFPSGPDGEVLANRHMERSNDSVVAEVGGVILLADSRDRGDKSMITYEVGPGQHIDRASQEAIRIATEANEDVQFTFNDITLTAMPHGSPAQLSALFFLLCEQRAKAYRNSPKGKAEARARKLELKEN
jgi:hypothetical protein